MHSAFLVAAAVALAGAFIALLIWQGTAPPTRTQASDWGSARLASNKARGLGDNSQR